MEAAIETLLSMTDCDESSPQKSSPKRGGKDECSCEMDTFSSKQSGGRSSSRNSKQDSRHSSISPSPKGPKGHGSQARERQGKKSTENSSQGYAGAVKKPQQQQQSNRKNRSDDAPIRTRGSAPILLGKLPRNRRQPKNSSDIDKCRVKYMNTDDGNDDDDDADVVIEEENEIEISDPSLSGYSLFKSSSFASDFSRTGDTSPDVSPRQQVANNLNKQRNFSDPQINKTKRFQNVSGPSISSRRNQNTKVNIGFGSGNSLVVEELQLSRRKRSKTKTNADTDEETTALDRAKKCIADSVKILILMRGVPGSGKSFLAERLKAQGVVLSTDDFFVKRNGIYQYNFNQLTEAHDWNKKRAQKTLKQGITPVIIDNTNTQSWEMKPYVAMAVRAGYRVEVIEPDTKWKFNARELARKNVHNVSKDKIQEMLERYETNITAKKLLKQMRLRQPGLKAAGQDANTGEKPNQKRQRNRRRKDKPASGPFDDRWRNPNKESSSISSLLRAALQAVNTDNVQLNQGAAFSLGSSFPWLAPAHPKEKESDKSQPEAAEEKESSEELSEEDWIVDDFVDDDCSTDDWGSEEEEEEDEDTEEEEEEEVEYNSKDEDEENCSDTVEKVGEETGEKVQENINSTTEKQSSNDVDVTEELNIYRGERENKEIVYVSDDTESDSDDGAGSESSNEDKEDSSQKIPQENKYLDRFADAENTNGVININTCGTANRNWHPDNREEDTLTQLNDNVMSNARVSFEQVGDVFSNNGADNNKTSIWSDFSDNDRVQVSSEISTPVSVILQTPEMFSHTSIRTSGLSLNDSVSISNDLLLLEKRMCSDLEKIESMRNDIEQLKDTATANNLQQSETLKGNLGLEYLTRDLAHLQLDVKSDDVSGVGNTASFAANSSGNGSFEVPASLHFTDKGYKNRNNELIAELNKNDIFDDHLENTRTESLDALMEKTTEEMNSIGDSILQNLLVENESSLEGEHSDKKDENSSVFESLSSNNVNPFGAIGSRNFSGINSADFSASNFEDCREDVGTSSFVGVIGSRNSSGINSTDFSASKIEEGREDSGASSFDLIQFEECVSVTSGLNPQDASQLGKGTPDEERRESQHSILDDEFDNFESKVTENIETSAEDVMNDILDNENPSLDNMVESMEVSIEKLGNKISDLVSSVTKELYSTDTKNNDQTDGIENVSVEEDAMTEKSESLEVVNVESKEVDDSILSPNHSGDETTTKAEVGDTVSWTSELEDISGKSEAERESFSIVEQTSECSLHREEQLPEFSTGDNENLHREDTKENTDSLITSTEIETDLIPTHEYEDAKENISPMKIRRNLFSSHSTLSAEQMEALMYGGVNEQLLKLWEKGESWTGEKKDVDSPNDKKKCDVHSAPKPSRQLTRPKGERLEVLKSLSEPDDRESETEIMDEELAAWDSIAGKVAWDSVVSASPTKDSFCGPRPQRQHFPNRQPIPGSPCNAQGPGPVNPLLCDHGHQSCWIGTPKVRESCTITSHQDYVLTTKSHDSSQVDANVKVVTARSRNICEGVTVKPTERFSGVLKFDKSSMTDDVLEHTDVDSLSQLQLMFPHIDQDDLADIYHKCQNDLNWAADILLDTDVVSFKTNRTAVSEANLSLSVDNESASEVKDEVEIDKVTETENIQSVWDDTEGFDHQINSKFRKNRRVQSGWALQLKKELEGGITVTDSIASRRASNHKMKATVKEEPSDPLIEENVNEECAAVEDITVDDQSSTGSEEEETFPMTLDPNFAAELHNCFGNSTCPHPKGKHCKFPFYVMLVVLVFLMFNISTGLQFSNGSLLFCVSTDNHVHIE